MTRKRVLLLAAAVVAVVLVTVGIRALGAPPGGAVAGAQRGRTSVASPTAPGPTSAPTPSTSLGSPVPTPSDTATPPVPSGSPTPGPTRTPRPTPSSTTARPPAPPPNPQPPPPPPGPSPQTIRFDGWTVPYSPLTFPREMGAVSSSGLPVVYELIDSVEGACLVQGSALDLDPNTFPTTCVVRASQPGNSSFLPAQPVEATLVVRGAPSHIVLVSKPTEVEPGRWQLSVTDPDAIASEVLAESLTGEICQPSIQDQGSPITFPVVVDVEVLATGTCRIEASGNGFLVYGGTPATVEFAVVAP